MSPYDPSLSNTNTISSDILTTYWCVFSPESIIYTEPSFSFSQSIDSSILLSSIASVTSSPSLILLLYLSDSIDCTSHQLTILNEYELPYNSFCFDSISYNITQ